jgi:membrane protein implicated in regulation of membrane protease activity
VLSFVDPGTVLALAGGYIAAAVGIFLLYSPVLLLMVGLLLAAGLLQLLAWPFIVLIRKLRRKPERPQDSSWLLH